MRRMLFLIIIIFPLLTIGCGDSSSSRVSLNYQPPVVPIAISLDTYGNVEITVNGEILTPIGVFSLEYSHSLYKYQHPEEYFNVPKVLVLRVNNQDTVYALDQKNFDIEVVKGCYKPSIKKSNTYILVDLQKVNSGDCSAPLNTPSPKPTHTSFANATAQQSFLQRSPTPTKMAYCSVSVYEKFQEVWKLGGGISAGCPIGPPYKRRVAFQPFENGFMLWRASPTGDAGGMIYVLYNSGRWQEYYDDWVEGMSESSGAMPPNGLVEPRRGFGNLWRKLGGPNSSIGWALQNEIGSDFGLLQDFPNNAVIFHYPDRPIVFMPDGKRWVQR